jgi:uncharacterized protein (DUF2336 family)
LFVFAVYHTDPHLLPADRIATPAWEPARGLSLPECAMPVQALSAIDLPEAHQLIAEIGDVFAGGDEQARIKILDRVTNLFLTGSRRYTQRQIALFDDVLLRLTADIEMKARAKLATRLAGLDNMPAKLIRSLAFDDAIEVAGPILKDSPQLSDDDLVENASSKSQDHLYAIAQRLKLSEAVTDVLVERGDRRVVRTVARNGGASISFLSYAKLTARARNDTPLAVAMAKRSDLPRQYFIQLVEAASAAVREKLEAANPAAAAAILGAIDETAGEMRDDARKASRQHAIAVRDARRRFRAHNVTESHVHARAHAQEFEKTVVALARLGGFSFDQVERALLDQGSEFVVILAKASGCSWTTTKALLKMYAAKRELSQDELDRMAASFEQLNQQTAQHIVKFCDGRTKPHSPARATAATEPNLENA